jgi:hypothetical protein
MLQATQERVLSTSLLPRPGFSVCSAGCSAAVTIQVKARLAAWLEPRGLAFNGAKTRIVPLSEGFDFLDSIFAATQTGSYLSSQAPWLLRGSGTGLQMNSVHSAGPN